MKTVIIHGRRISDVSPRILHPDAEALWGVGSWNQRGWSGGLTDWTAWFDVHPENPVEWFMGIQLVRPATWRWYQQQTAERPIYLLRRHGSIPASVAYPRDEIQRAFGSRGQLNTRFTCTVDWMIAKAMHDGFERIVFNGIGVHGGELYQFQHKGILYWLGRAEERGLQLDFDLPSCYVPPEKVYGYECGPPPSTTWPQRVRNVQPKSAMAVAMRRQSDRARRLASEGRER